MRVGLAGVLLAGVISTSMALGGVADTVQDVVASKLLSRAQVGVMIVKLADTPDKCRVLYEHNAHAQLAPASNMKAITTSAALATLGPTFKFRTVLLRNGQDLIVWGDGDPTLGDAELMQKVGWDMLAVYKDWGEQLRKRGVTTVRNVIVDDSIFDEQFLHPRWDKHRFQLFGAELGGLNFNVNTLEFTVQASSRGTSWTMHPATSYVKVAANRCTAGGSSLLSIPREPESNTVSLHGTIAGSCQASITIHDPSLYSATVLAETLVNNGINVTGGVGRDRSTRQRYAAATADQRTRDWPVMCIFETPIASVINRANKDSQNLYAEALCKRSGAAASGQSGSWANGTGNTGRFLQKLGVSPSEFVLDDGCGLSRDNRISANAVTRVLMYDWVAPYRQMFVNSLSVGGVDGTLKKRFGNDLEGRVHAKTGFIEGVSCLSGYLQARDDNWYAFSILINGIPAKSNSSIKPLQDRIVKAIDDQATPAQQARR